ncbi:transposase [Aeribacillus composti]|uniref:transposase n=1 Tax=Aeribacillus composti TaxID=1868734 RepID=UPI00406A4BDC
MGGNHRVYVLFDSSYTSKSLIETCLTKGWYVIAALKTNQILYSKGIRPSVKEFARYIAFSDTHLVTVGGEVYRIECIATKRD